MSLSAIGAKNKKPLSRKGCLKERLSPLFRWSEESSEWELSVLSARSDLSLLLSAGNALNQQGIPESQLLSLAGMMCEMCGFLRLWLLFFFHSFFAFLPPLFFSRHGLVMVGRSVGRSGGWGGIGLWVSGNVLAAHSLSSLPPLLPVGLKRSMVLTGKEKEREKKERGVEVVLARMGFNRENVWTLKRKWVECWEHFCRMVGALLEFEWGRG